MRFLIAHRGNLDGPNPESENTMAAALDCISKGFAVELDIWYYNGLFYLGHDKPEHKIKRKDLLMLNEKYPQMIFWHCKNIECIYKIIIQQHYFYKNYWFFHQKDDISVVNGYENFIWLYPGITDFSYKSIVVMPELTNKEYQDMIINLGAQSKIKGICSDYILDIKKKVEDKRNELQIK